MRTHIRLALIGLAGLAVIAAQAQQKPATPPVLGKEIAPLMTAETMVVIRTDIASFDFDAAARMLDATLKKAGEKPLSEDEKFAEAKQKLNDYKKAGARTLYTIFDESSMRAGPLNAITLAKNADVAALAKLFDVELIDADTEPLDEDDEDYYEMF